MRRSASTSRWTYCWRRLALRPPNSGGLPGSSQPSSNSSRCQRRDHSGACELDVERSAVSASGGRLASTNASNSALKAWTSASKDSCTVLLGDQRPVLVGPAEQQLAGLGPLEGELQVVFPGEAHGAVELETVPE